MRFTALAEGHKSDAAASSRPPTPGSPAAALAPVAASGGFTGGAGRALGALRKSAGLKGGPGMFGNLVLQVEGSSRT